MSILPRVPLACHIAISVLVLAAAAVSLDARAQSSTELREELERGMQLLTEGNYRQAVKVIKRANEAAEGTCEECLLLLATAYSHQGKLQQTEALARELLAISSQPELLAPAHNLLGLVQFRRALASGQPSDPEFLELMKQAEASFSIADELAEGRDATFQKNLTEARGWLSMVDPDSSTLPGPTRIRLTDGSGQEAPATPLETEVSARANEARALARAGQLEAAIAAYEEAVSLASEPGHAAFLYDELGRLLLNHGRHEDAIEAFKDSIALDPRAIPPRNGLGDTLVAMGRFEEAIVTYRQVVDAYPDAVLTLHALGRALLAAGRGADAAEVFRRALEPAGNDPNTSVGITLTDSAALRALGYVNLGAALLLDGQPREAAAALQSAIELEPDSVAAHYNLGLALQAVGSMPEAIAAYRRAIELEPDHSAALQSLGNVLREQGQLEEAIGAYSEVLEQHPDAAAAWSGISSVARDLGNLEETVQASRAALEIDPEDPVAYSNLAYGLHRQGRREEAIVAYREAVRLNPDDASVLVNLGNALREEGQVTEAIEVYRRAAGLDPRDARIYSNLGAALRKAGRVEEAIGIYRRGLRLDDENPVLYNNLAVALCVSGRTEECLEAYLKALELWPDNRPRTRE